MLLTSIPTISAAFMPREIVTVSVGQAGNQLGRTFWSLALHEHASFSSSNATPSSASTGAPMYDDSMSTFFRNVSPLNSDLQPGTAIHDLKARSVCVDTEGGVLESTMRGPLRDLFQPDQVFLAGAAGASGAGNNWAHGHYGYGSRHGDAFLECLRRQTERCDSLQSFFLLHSLGGGTGSGLGTRLLGMLEDEYGGVYRFAASVFPQEGGGDVVTGDYNAVS